MAKRNRVKDNKKLLKESRGSGIGKEYLPWIKIQDVPSRGRVTRIKGITTHRQHELMSDMERDYFYLLDFSEEVIDIREQYPLLPIEDTLAIALELGIKHPEDPQTHEPIVMTTDFLITINKNGQFIDVARTIKSKDDLLNKRVLEKFEIERQYWKRKEIDWAIVTEQEINKTVAHNISFVHGYKNIEDIDSFVEISNLEIRDFIYEFLKRIIDDKRSMRNICFEFDSDMHLEKGSGLSIFKYLIINKIIDISLKEKIDVNKNILIEAIKENEITKVEVI